MNKKKIFNSILLIIILILSIFLYVKMTILLSDPVYVGHLVEETKNQNNDIGLPIWFFVIIIIILFIKIEIEIKK